MKIAVASSGLGQVARGIETWALDTAFHLHKKGEDVCLFGAGVVDRDVPYRIVDCMPRDGCTARVLSKLMPGFMWRKGLKSPYGWEQFSFWKKLAPILQRERFDILHVQDPMLAYWCRRARKEGRIKTKEILAHGTEEPASFLAQFEFLQHLAPWHLEQTRSELRKTIDEQRLIQTTRHWYAIPNFIDVQKFRPVGDVNERKKLRNRLGIPEDVFIVGCVAAIKKDHKRIDHLINECGAASGLNQNLFLLVIGARTDQTDALLVDAHNMLGDRVRFMTDISRDQMPEYYRAMDVFVLPSIFEMMPIALLEALASGIPVLVNRHPVLEWMSKDGGILLDMNSKGSLADTICSLKQDFICRTGISARIQAEQNFSAVSVIPRYIGMYKEILEEKNVAPRADPPAAESLKVDEG